MVNAVAHPKEAKIHGDFKKCTDIKGLRKCYPCGTTRHFKAACSNGVEMNPAVDFVLAVADGDSACNWILDSVSSRHLVKDLSLLEDPVDYEASCFTAASDGERLRITKRGSVTIRVKALGVFKSVRLLDVQCASNLEWNIISFRKLTTKGCVLEYRDGRRVLVAHSGAPIMDIGTVKNVLVVKVFEGFTGDIFRGIQG